MDGKRRKARELAQEHIGRGDPTGWFEPLYSGAAGDATQIPWADLVPNPYFREWAKRTMIAGRGKRAMVAGCGLGDDAEAVAALGFETVAFDISATAIEWCRARFPDSEVDYRVADLTSPPEGWGGAFDFVLEVYTLQVLPPDLRGRAQEQLASLLAQGGTLLALARRQAPGEKVGTSPWIMLKEDLDRFQQLELREVSFEEFPDLEDTSVRRYRAAYRRL